jgi:hypothetical protein
MWRLLEEIIICPIPKGKKWQASKVVVPRERTGTVCSISGGDDFNKTAGKPPGDAG